jgi:hypothetical protein
MKTPLYLLWLLCLLTSCAATVQGPDDAQKTRLAEYAAQWANLYNASDWDKLKTLYDGSFDFNGTRMRSSKATQVMRDFRAADPEFQIILQAGDWVLDSMKGDVFAGHLKGKAYYDHKSLEMQTEIILWMKMADENPPIIISQYDHLAEAKSQLMRRFKDREMATQDFDANDMPNLTFWEGLLEKIRPKLGNIRYCTKFEGKRLIYAMGIKNSGKMGIFDEYGQAILHCAYDDIGGIGTLFPGVVEVMRDNKYGVIKMDGSTVLAAEYDAILPAIKSSDVAYYAQSDGQWMAYDSSGHPLEGNGIENLDWVAYLQQLPKQFHQAPLASFAGEDDQEQLSAGLFRAPFALAKRNILHDSFSYAGYFTDGENGGSSQGIGEVARSRDGNIRIISIIESWGISARSEYHDSESQWVVFDKDMDDILQRTSLVVKNIVDFSVNNGGRIEPQCNQDNWHLLGDTMIEVHSNQNAIDYWQMPKFTFFRVKDSGELDTIMPGRQFPFMSMLQVNAKMLQGCFRGSSSQEEAEAWYQAQKGKKDELVENQHKEGELASYLERTADHYRAADLDYLVNEVYAAHGYIFTKPKWQDYFKTQKWYKAAHENVEGMLTPLERANIDFIRTVQSEMKGKEEAYTKPSFEFTSGFYGG